MEHLIEPPKITDQLAYGLYELIANTWIDINIGKKSGYHSLNSLVQRLDDCLTHPNSRYDLTPLSEAMASVGRTSEFRAELKKLYEELKRISESETDEKPQGLIELLRVASKKFEAEAYGRRAFFPHSDHRDDPDQEDPLREYRKY